MHSSASSNTTLCVTYSPVSRASVTTYKLPENGGRPWVSVRSRLTVGKASPWVASILGKSKKLIFFWPLCFSAFIFFCSFVFESVKHGKYPSTCFKWSRVWLNHLQSFWTHTFPFNPVQHHCTVSSPYAAKTLGAGQLKSPEILGTVLLAWEVSQKTKSDAKSLNLAKNGCKFI